MAGLGLSAREAGLNALVVALEARGPRGARLRRLSTADSFGPVRPTSARRFPWLPPLRRTSTNHRRFDPFWHFSGALIIAVGVIAAVVHAVRHREASWNWWLVVYTFGVALVVFRARGADAPVQDRVIRLEMRLRLKDVLPAALAARIGELTHRQLIGLRFASDAELPAFVERCLSGQLADDEAVKKEIRNWQADWLRA